jgi:hypothetical protein
LKAEGTHAVWKKLRLAENRLMKTTTSIAAFTAAFLFYCTGSSAQNHPAAIYASGIDSATIGKHLYILASDSLEGRETAKPGMEKAARYVAAEFKKYGLPPLANGTYYQQVPLINLLPGLTTVDGRNRHYNEGNDFYTTSTYGSLSFEVSDIVFAGYGICDSVSGWNDLKDVEGKGKIIMILEGEPKDKNGKSLAGETEHSKESRLTCLSHLEPRAVLLIKQDFEERKDRVSRWIKSGRLALDQPGETSKIPVINISPSMANDFLRIKGYDVSSYEKKIAARKKPMPLFINDSLSFEGKQPRVFCNNVLGFVEGTDLKDEVVVVTAHLDHLGIRDEGIYYGADDDGSGCSSILAMASAMASAKKDGAGPRRSVLFMTFTGEEKGLLGSQYYTDHPVFPLDKTVANLNMDMIGRVDTINGPAGNYVYIIGSNRISDTLHAVNERANQHHAQLKLDYRYNDPNDKLKLYYRSDHYNFIKKDIPVIFYFTGLHPDYHKPTDTPEKVDLNQTARIARLVFYTAWELANREGRPDVKKTAE